MWLEWHIAWQLLRDSRAQSLTMLGGITVGAAVVVFISALINGLQANIVERTLGTQAHIRLLPAEERNRTVPMARTGELLLTLEDPRPQRLRSISNWQALVELIDGLPEIRAVSPLVSGPALGVRGLGSRSVSVIGAEPDRLRAVLPIADNMIAGEYRLVPGEAVIGSQLATDLGLQTGSRMRLEAADGRQAVLRIAGVFELGVREVDSRFVCLDFDEARTLLDLPGGATVIELTVNDVFDAERLARRIAALTGVRAESWMETNAQLLNALASQSLSTGMIQLFVTISVAFGIASVLGVSVIQRTREIGILRAMGLGRGRMLRVFLLQGALLGAAGAGLGALLGFALVHAFLTFGPRLFEIDIDGRMLPLAMLLAGLVGLLAAAWPARRAARLDPAVAIRNV